MTPGLPVLILDIHYALSGMHVLQAYLVAVGAKPLPLRIVELILKAHLRRIPTLSIDVSCTEPCIPQQWINQQVN